MNELKDHVEGLEPNKQLLAEWWTKEGVTMRKQRQETPEFVIKTHGNKKMKQHLIGLGVNRHSVFYGCFTEGVGKMTREFYKDQKGVAVLITPVERLCTLNDDGVVVEVTPTFVISHYVRDLFRVRVTSGEEVVERKFVGCSKYSGQRDYRVTSGFSFKRCVEKVDQLVLGIRRDHERDDIQYQRLVVTEDEETLKKKKERLERKSEVSMSVIGAETIGRWVDSIVGAKQDGISEFIDILKTPEFGGKTKRQLLALLEVALEQGGKRTVFVPTIRDVKELRADGDVRVSLGSWQLRGDLKRIVEIVREFQQSNLLERKQA